MLLDLFPDEQAETEKLAMQQAAPDLPIGFGEAFRTSVDTRAKFSGTLAENSNRYDVWQKTLDRFEELTGEALPNPEVGDGQTIRGQIAKRFDARRADIGDLKAPEEQDVAAGALQTAQDARARDTAAQGRARDFGAGLGFFTGDAAAAMADPVNIAGMALGAPAAAGILRTALMEGGAALLSETAVQASTYGFKTQADPTFSLGDAASEVAAAGVGGAVLGGGIKGLASVWRRYRGSGAAVPRHVVDAGNVVDSEADIATSNPFPDAAGEAKHTGALAKAVDDVSAGRPVDVSEAVGPVVAREGLADLDPPAARAASEGSPLVEKARAAPESLTPAERGDLVATRVHDAAPPEAFAAVSAAARAEGGDGLQVFARNDPSVTITGLEERGPVAEGFEGRWSEAVDWMREQGGGVAARALDHPDIGPIDVPWGFYDRAADKGMGLAKIIAKHPDVADDLPATIARLPVESRSANRVILASPDHRAVVRLDFNGEDKPWLMTAYRDERNDRRVEGTTGRPDNRSADTSSAAPTSRNIASGGAIEQTAAAAMRDMTPDQALDAAATPEAAAALAHRADNMQAAEPRPVHVTRADGTVETRDYHEMMREIDDEISAADELKNCVVGIEPGETT